MEKLSIALTSYILKKGIISEENFDIYSYGFCIFLEVFLSVICSIFIAAFLSMWIECILFFLFFIPLRSYNGGLHFEKYVFCLFFSCLTLIGILLVVKHYSVELHVSFTLYFLSLVLIKTIGSVSHPNRPVQKEENLIFKKRSNLTLLISLLAALIFIITGSEKYLFLETMVFLLVSSTMLIGKIRYLHTNADSA